MRIFVFIFLFALQGCSADLQVIRSRVNNAVGGIGCPDNSSQIFDILNLYVEKNNQLPSKPALLSIIEQNITDSWSSKISKADLERIKVSFKNYFNLIYKSLEGKDKQKILESLASFEVGVIDGFELGAFTSEIQNSISDIHQSAMNAAIDCEEGSPVPSKDFIHVLFGIQKTMSIAYQSCHIPQIAPLDEFSKELKGIKITGKHPDGVGNKREIEFLEDLLETHHYINDTDRPANCFQVQNNPLIYDYGGKPFAISERQDYLNFFKDSGSGTSVLGVDCSGYVFSVLVASGRKFHPTNTMKATLVNGVPARAYMDPEKNGMTCFEKIKVGKSGTIKSGDLAASGGHIFVIDEIGEDPLGIGKIKKKEDCSKIKSNDFNFLISQSSPSKGGVGINRYLATDYFKDVPSQGLAIEKYAQAACVAFFENSDVLVEGQSVQIIRHKGTQDCLMKPFEFEHQGCVSSCL